MLAHLWAQAPAPAEYVELSLCREFGCLPSELRREPVENVLEIMAMISAENKVKAAHSKVKRR